MRTAAAVFLGFLALYVCSMPPALAPYRDSGEMTAGASTLGVCHPPSYPLYVLAGRVARSLPLGNEAYRLTLLSASAGAAAAAVLAGAVGGWAGVGAALLLGLNPTFWSVCLVPEMYSLWILAAVCLMAAAMRLGRDFNARLWYATAGLFGLSLANRLDLLLWAPGLLWACLARRGEATPRQAGLWALLAFAAFPAVMVASGSNAPIALLIAGTAVWLGRRESRTWWAATLGLAILGLSAYLYLPVRSASGPWLDWNHPATWDNLKETLLRSRYGGTLDLLSKNYAKGELFGANMVLYGRHLWSAFWALGLAAAAAGCWSGARRDFNLWLGQAAAYWWSGPVFLLMANMPPNPHAAAIVEPHYLLSDAVLAFWAAQGLSLLVGGRALAAPALATLFAVVPLARGRLASADRRGHFFSYDFAKNALRCAPPGATLVARKDVQLYSLWHYQTVQGWRPDLRVVSQGLSGAGWYQAGWRRREPGFTPMRLREAAAWRTFSALNGNVLATMDTELSLPVSEIRPRGLLWEVAGGGAPASESDFLWELMPRRGDYRYEAQPDFFTSDLVAGYAQSRYHAGAAAFAQGGVEQAERLFAQAWSMHWLFPEPAVFLGYAAFARKNWEESARYYGLAVGLLEQSLALSEAYRSLPELKADFRRRTAEALIQLGVTRERQKRDAEAEAAYRRALALHPLPQAHFNLAVLFWKKDPARAREELLETLRLAPDHAEAERFLRVLESRPKGGY